MERGIDMNRIVSVLILIILPGLVFADGTITGQVENSETARPLVGANIILTGTELGAASGEDGQFTITGVPPGNYAVRVTHIGYESASRNIEVNDGSIRLDFALTPTELRAPRVIVEPTRAEARKSPVTFSEISTEELEQRNQVQDIPVMLSDLPSTTNYSETGTGIGYNYLTMRGFDQRRISVFINGVPQNDPEDHNVYWINFYDLAGSLQDIQVQRGSGTASYGPASIGGSINLVTQNYSRESRLKAETAFGSYNTQKYSIEGSTGLLGGHWIGYGRVTRVTSDNYRDWSWMDFWRYFAGIAYYDDNHVLKIQTYGGRQKDGLAYYGIPKDWIDDPEKRTTNYSRATRDIEWFNQPHYELHHQWQVNSALLMSNTLYYIKGYGYFDYGGSWASPSYFRINTSEHRPSGWGASDVSSVSMASNTMIREFVDNDQIGLLHRYIWDHDRGELTAGISVRGHESLHWGRILESDGLVYQPADTAAMGQVSRSLPEIYTGEEGRKYYNYNGGKTMFSLFAHENYELLPALNAMVDLQLTRTEYRFWNEKYEGHEFTVPYLFLNPGVGLNYNFTSTLNTYVNVSRTTREPRMRNYYNAGAAGRPGVQPQFGTEIVNGDTVLNYDEPLVHPETLYDYEFGFGYRSGKTAFQANLYLMDFRNEIVKNGQLDRYGQPVTGNADRTRHYGLELSGDYRLMPNLRLTGNFTFSRNYFVDFVSIGTADRDTLDGNTLAGFPGELGNWRVEYSPGQLHFSLDGKYVGKQYTTNRQDNGPFVDPYTVWNARVSYRIPVGDTAIKTALTVNNLFNRLYASYGDGTNFYPAAPRSYYLSLEWEM